MLSNQQIATFLIVVITLPAVGFILSHGLHRSAVKSLDEGSENGCLFWEVLSIVVFAVAMFAYFRFVGSYP